MLYVNTISFNGKKACINSYSPQFIKELESDMNKQREFFATRFPNAVVKTEHMSEAETIALVAAGNIGHLRSLVWEIGKESE